jgi:hypothetical protein
MIGHVQRDPLHLLYKPLWFAGVEGSTIRLMNNVANHVIDFLPGIRNRLSIPQLGRAALCSFHF